MPSNKQITVTLRTLADIGDVTKKAKDIQDSLNKIQLPQKLKTSLETTFGDLYKEVEKASSAMAQGFKTKGDVTKYERTIGSINGLLTKLYTNIQNINTEKLDIKVNTEEFKDLQKQVNQLQSDLKNIAINRLKQLENFKAPSGAKAWEDFFTALREEVPDIEKAEKALDVLQNQVNKATQAGKDGAGIWPEYKKKLAELQEVLTNVKNSMAETTTKIDDLTKKQSDLKLEALREAETNANKAKTGITDLSQSMTQYGKETVASAHSTQQLGSELDQFKNRIAYFFGLNNAVRLFQRAVRSAVSTVKELDAALTETAVVTDFSVSDMWAKIPEYTERANQLGVTIKDVAEASTLYYQQGLKTNEVNAVTTATLKMARIAGLDAADATDRMTNALRGFNMEITETNADRIADVYSKLAAISASNVDEISTAMTKTASLASNANMQFETTAAFLAQIIETTRESAETAGTALKTVIARFSEVKELFSRGELLGTDEEGEAIDVNKVSKALRTAGIDLNEYLTGMKGLDDIFMELASKWDSLDQVQQRYIATMAAGSRQQSRFIAMMQDYGRTQELVAAAQGAAGASQQQYQKTLDSLESKLNQLKNAWDDFVTDVVNQKAIKFAVDGLRAFLDIINKLTGDSGIAKLAVAFGGFKIGRGFVSNMFKGTKIAELFSKEGAKAGLGFINGIENSVKGFKKFNLKDTLFKNVDLDYTSSNLSAWQNMLDQSFSGTMKLKDAQEQYNNIILASNNLRNTGLTLAEQAVLLDGSETSQKLLEAMATRELTEDERKELQVKAAEMDLGKQGLIVRAAETSRRLLNAVGLKQETLLKWLKIPADKAEEKALWGLTKAQWASLGAMTAIIVAIGALIAITTQLIKLTPEGKLKTLEEELEKNTTAANEASEAYSNLNDSLNNLEDKSKTIAGLTKGTTEWKDAVRSVNSQILELLDKYPELNKYIKISNDGVMSLDEGYETVLQNYQRKADEANFKTAKSRAAVNTQKNVIARNSTTLYSLEASGIIPEGLTEKLLSSGKQAISKADIEKALQEYNNAQRNIIGEDYTNATIDSYIQDTIINTINRSLNAQRTNDAETQASNTGILASILSNGQYNQTESELLKNYINNIDLSKITDLTDLEDRASQYLSKAGLDNRYARLMSGELQQEDITWFDNNKTTIKNFIDDIGGNFTQLSEVVDGVKKTFEDVNQKFESIGLNGEGWWSNQGGTTTSNILAKYDNLSSEQRETVTDAITKITKGLSDEQKSQFISQLFSTNWESIDALEILDTQLDSLGIEVDNVNLQELIEQIIDFKKAASIKATAENLSSNINAQNEILDNVYNGSVLSGEQKQMAIDAGAAKDQFIMTSAGWVYTGDPADLIENFGRTNADMYENALKTYRNDPNEANRENVNQMAQIIGASGGNYMRNSIDEEALKNQTEGAKASLKLIDIGNKYIEKAKEVEKENSSLANSYIRSANAATKLLPKFQSLSEVINDNAESLKKNDPDALAKVAKAASDAFGVDISSKFVADNKKALIDFASGVEGSFDKISDAIIEENSFTIDSLFEDYGDLSKYITDLNWDAEGQFHIEDQQLMQQLAGDTEAAMALEKALKAAGIAMDFEWVEERVPMIINGHEVYDPKTGEPRMTTIKTPKRVTLTNALKQQETINAKSGGNKSKTKSKSGSKEKEKYWDNPYDELYNLIEDQNEALRTREKLEREYDRILKRRTSTAKELIQNSLDEITNLQKEIDIQEQIQAGRRRMIGELGSRGTYRDSEGKEKSFDKWGVTKYASYDYNTNTISIDWEGIDKINDPDKGGAVEAYISKLEELSKSFEETQDQIEEMKDLVKEIKERNMQEYLEFEERVYQAIIDREQKVIDEYSALSDTIAESNNRIVDSLRESIDMERQIRDNTKTEEDIADKEARLAYLQRDTSGANQQEILKLQEELGNARESYGDTLVDQAIDQLQKDNELAAEQRAQQIEIMQAQLDWQNENGLYWPEVYSLIANSFNEDGTFNNNSALIKLLEESEAFKGMSKFGKENWEKELISEWLAAIEGLYNWENQEEEEPISITQTTTVTAASNTTATAETVTTKSGGSTKKASTNKKSTAKKSNSTKSTSTATTTNQGMQKAMALNEARKAELAEEATVSALRNSSMNPTQQAAVLDYLKKKGTVKAYASGGLVDSTGPAWLDGTKSAPEMVLSARDTQNFIALRNALTQMLAQGGGKGGDNYFDIQINVDELGSDYDVDQLASRIKKQIYDESSYRNVNAISYLR